MNPFSSFALALYAVAFVAGIMIGVLAEHVDDYIRYFTSYVL